MSFVTSLMQQVPATSQTGLSADIMYPSSELNSQSYLSRVPSLSDNIYGTSHMYAPTSTGSRPGLTGYNPMQKSTDPLKSSVSVGQHYYVDNMMNPHPYNSMYPFDINAVRRKNATRETTGPLKAWLKQHRQNPYPTKGEKVMLAISTRMTLTQVSTWFANARRRMKKDKFDNEDEDKEELDSDDNNKRERCGSVSSRESSNESNTSKDLSDLSDAEELNVKTRSPKRCVQRLFSPTLRHDHVIDESSSPESLPESPESGLFCETRLPAMSEVMKNVTGNVPTPTSENLPPQKPKIWSISEIIGSATKTVNDDYVSNYASTSTLSSNPHDYSMFNMDYNEPPVTDYRYYHDQAQMYQQQDFLNSMNRSYKPTIQYL